MKTRCLVLVFSFLTALGCSFVATPTLAQTAAPVSNDSTYPEHAIGRADAPLTVIEYSSVLCNHCATFHREVLPEIRKAYIDTGKVRWVFRDQSLGNPWALVGAMVLRCAPADTNYALRNSLMENAHSWYTDANPLAKLKSYVALAGIEGGAVDACVKNPAVLESIRAGEREASEHGINSTPTFWISGVDKPLVGFQTFEKLQKVLDPLVKRR